MANLSQLYPSGGIKSIQTGFITRDSTASNWVNGPTGEDDFYFDITISPVDVNKCMLDIKGVNNLNYQYITYRLVDSTTLRISGGGNRYALNIRYYIYEFY